MSDTLTYQQMGDGGPRPGARAVRSDDGLCRGHGLRLPDRMHFAVRRSVPLRVGMLGAFGLLTGLAVAPTVAYNGSMDPRALWKRLLTSAFMTAAAAWGGETDG